MQNTVKILKIILLLVLCGGLGYNVYLGVRKQIPCLDPIPYAIGEFSTQFKVSEEYFLDALKDAEDIWEVTYGKDLFAHSPEYKKKDLLKVNLVYDYRQEATNKLNNLSGVVESNQATYDNMEAKYKILKANYNRDETTLNTRVEKFNKDSQEYENDVSYWNKQGGAPEKEYNALQAESSRLDAEIKYIQKEQARLEAVVDEINALVVSLNKLADKLNINVRNYNTTNAGRGESFEEGIYVSDGNEAYIDIYEFSSRNKLVRVLAHELGHAIGIDHVPGSTSIMYEFNEGDSMTLSDDDVQALKVVCGVE